MLFFLVSEDVSAVQGFTCANHQTGYVWALFVIDEAQGQGHGSLTPALRTAVGLSQRQAAVHHKRHLFSIFPLPIFLQSSDFQLPDEAKQSFVLVTGEGGRAERPKIRVRKLGGCLAGFCRGRPNTSEKYEKASSKWGMTTVPPCSIKVGYFLIGDMPWLPSKPRRGLPD